MCIRDSGGNAGRVQAPLIVEGANGPLSPEADEILKQKGCRLICDFTANLLEVWLYDAVIFGTVPPAVSYTHLDVYKRQSPYWECFSRAVCRSACTWAAVVSRTKPWGSCRRITPSRSKTTRGCRLRRTNPKSFFTPSLWLESGENAAVPWVREGHSGPLRLSLIHI